jgi:hypothetical protein
MTTKKEKKKSNTLSDAYVEGKLSLADVAAVLDLHFGMLSELHNQ